MNALDEKHLTKLLNELFIMKKTNFTELSKKNNITLEEFTEQIKKSHLKDKELYFYTKKSQDK